MKKRLVILLILAMVLSLAACGEPEETKASGSQNLEQPAPSESQEPQPSQSIPSGDVLDPDTIPEIDLEDIMAGGAANTIWGLQDQATKDALVAQGKEDGYDVSFGADGSTTIVDTATGEVSIQKPDGTWTIQSEDGTIGQYGGDWPDNEFTRLLPKPSMELMGASTNDQEFTVAFQNATLDQIKAYVELVKAAGFTLEPVTEEQAVMDMVIYTYMAKNTDGYTVTVSSAMGVSAIVVEKP